MALRQIIEIDEQRCDGCGSCETGCPEGALRVIDGKARLVGESLCDGLGACLGGCPRGAIRVTMREAEAYDELKVVEGIARQGAAVLRAHLDHLEHHGQSVYLSQALGWLKSQGLDLPAPASRPEATASRAAHAGAALGCPGSRERRFSPLAAPRSETPTASPSALSHWPIQLHLINPRAPQFSGARLLVAADCTAFALGSFHASLLEGRALVIACPKLDQGREIYVDKLATLLASAASVEVAIMEVPCCSGLVKLVLEARERAGTDKPVETLVVGIEGGIVGRRSL